MKKTDAFVLVEGGLVNAVEEIKSLLSAYGLSIRTRIFFFSPELSRVAWFTVKVGLGRNAFGGEREAFGGDREKWV